MQVARHLEAQQAELAVLGGILLDEGALDRVTSVLGADDFAQPRNRTIFECMTTLANGRRAVDLVTIATALEQSGELEACGGCRRGEFTSTTPRASP